MNSIETYCTECDESIIAFAVIASEYEGECSKGHTTTLNPLD